MSSLAWLALVCIVSAAAGYIGASLPYWLDPAWRERRRHEREIERRLLATLDGTSRWLDHEFGRARR